MDSWQVRPRKIGKFSKLESFQNWKVGKLECWKVGKLESREAGK